ncbi:chorismate mutase [Mycolicibacterium komossense]|uniref:Chorismate mutase n=1 Tax=Mycolicibacterium komossense TaxID=1779 RepID=A0ABT3CE39_9MYCO|nr:chorismate mutase [Mycolicibacterium komossense]MCV7227735.1 chorismate mutase [Mycolicibacterium komossense]
MTRLSVAPLATAAAVLFGVVGAVPNAQAETPSPFYNLVDAAAQRLLTADAVAAYKWIDGGPITDPPRVKVVLDNVGADAAAHRIDTGYVKRVFGDQINATEGVEYARFSQWKFDPASAPDTAPDLSASRSAIDGFNKTMVNEIALQWGSLHGPDCWGELASATSAVIGARQLDGLYQQALGFATHSYCS